MVVHDVEQYHESAAMSALHQLFKILRTAVAAIGRERENAIVTPIPPAGKVGNRHQFNRGDTEFDQIVEPFAYRRKSSGEGKGSNVQFIDDGIFPWAAALCVVVP